MKTQMIDRTEEKLKLAEELNLTSYVGTVKEKIEKEKAVKELTQMKFKPVTKKEINKLLIKRVWDWRILTNSSSSAMLLLVTGSIMTFISGCFLLAIHVDLLNNVQFDLGFKNLMNCIFNFGLFLWAVAILFCFRKTTLLNRPLNDWTDELPYGALLAVKEAKEAGVMPHELGYNERMLRTFVTSTTATLSEKTSYRIYYPVFASSGDRLKADPIITGVYKGVEVLIFAWDDGKVYE